MFDLADPDWLLVGDTADTAFGFIPANYIELAQAGAPQTAPGVAAAPSLTPVSNFAPPPQHKSRTPQPQNDVESVEHVDEDYEDAPPPMPSRPVDAVPEREYAPEPARAPLEEVAPAKPSRPVQSQQTGGYEQEEPVDQKQEHSFDGEYFRWYIDEVEGRKKRAVILSIGNGLIILKPNTTNPKKLRLRSASSLDNNWRIRDMVEYNHEKKHVFMEFKNPTASIELHAGSKDVAEAIVAVLGDLKGAEQAKGLKEVARASLTKTSATNRRVGYLLYDFKAQGHDELSVKEGDEVHVIDLSKSEEWWMCERTSDKKQGVVPSSYIEIVGTTNLDKLTDGVQRRKSERAGSSKGRVVDLGSSKRKHHRYSRDERDKIRESDRAKRDRGERTASSSNDKNMPNYHRVRTWIDSSGSFKVEAEFLGCVEGKIHLHKTNGVKIAVAATKLSIEDLEYVEKVTGTSLKHYKDEVAHNMSKKRVSGARQNGESAKPATPEKDTPGRPRLATATINDVPPKQPSREKSTALTVGEPDYDWFEFFLQCGVDIGNCQRYLINFSKEQMDESILEDISPSLLRSLGLREGDILRVMKHLDSKFDRKKAPQLDAPAGGLFTEPTGALKNNSTTEISKVNASALPVPSPQKEVTNPIASATNSSKFEDDAWAVKPAARSNEDLTRTTSRPQYTGSLQDLVDIKPLEANMPPQTPQKDAHLQPALATPNAPALTPVKTGTLIEPSQQFTVQKTGSSTQPLAPSQTGGLVPVRTGGLVPVRTGGLIPVQTGGLLPMQPTGFIPITAQPTGFVPIQQTGGLAPQLTFGIVPLQTGMLTFTPQRTGPNSWGPLAGPPPTTFGQIPLQPTNSFVPLQTGNVTMPQTSFNQPLVGGQATGGAFPQVTGQATGGLANTFVPQSTFGKQITGGFMPTTSFGAQATGGNMPQTSFSAQATGGNMPPTSFGSQMTGGNMPPMSFGSQATGGNMPPTSFGNQATGGFQNTQQGVNQMTDLFQNTSLGSSFQQQPYGQNFPQQQQQPSFGQQPFASQPTFGQPQASFGQQPTYGQQSFGQQNFGQNFGQQNFLQPAFGQQPTASFGQQPTASFGQQPPTSFGQQPQFEGFGSQPLQAQPTGLGFGNAPQLQAQQTGKRANLLAATADNPFGF